MSTALIVALIVVIAILAGTVVTVRKTARMGMPSADVLERATQRSKEIEAHEKADGGT
jgi:hypothetical protein